MNTTSISTGRKRVPSIKTKLQKANAATESRKKEINGLLEELREATDGSREYDGGTENRKYLGHSDEPKNPSKQMEVAEKLAQLIIRRRATGFDEEQLSCEIITIIDPESVVVAKLVQHALRDGTCTFAKLHKMICYCGPYWPKGCAPMLQMLARLENLARSNGNEETLNTFYELNRSYG